MDLVTQKVFIFKHVVFNESSLYNKDGLQPPTPLLVVSSPGILLTLPSFPITTFFLKTPLLTYHHLHPIKAKLLLHQ